MSAATFDGVISEYQNALGRDATAYLGLVVAGGSGAAIASVVSNHIVGFFHDNGIGPDPNGDSAYSKIALLAVMGTIAYGFAVARSDMGGGPVDLALGGMGLGAIAITGLLVFQLLIELSGNGSQNQALFTQPDLPLPDIPGRYREMGDEIDRYRGHPDDEEEGMANYRSQPDLAARRNGDYR